MRNPRHATHNPLSAANFSPLCSGPGQFPTVLPAGEAVQKFCIIQMKNGTLMMVVKRKFL